eukprot:9261406-Alexandrium_andersonii.AAC.1
MQDYCRAIQSAHNGDWSLNRCQHYCWADGHPCCNSPADCKRKLLEAWLPIFQMVCASGFLPRENQWFKLMQALKPWAAGIACHGLFARAFEMGLRALDLARHAQIDNDAD